MRKYKIQDKDKREKISLFLKEKSFWIGMNSNQKKNKVFIFGNIICIFGEVLVRF